MRLTVIIPVFNAMPYLPRAIDSILSQTYRPFQLLVVDDSSTDGSLAYLKTLTDTRLSLIRCAKRRGQGAARNVALAQCETEYTAFMDADDMSLPERLEKQVKFLEENRDIGLLGTRISYVSESGHMGFSPPLALTHHDIRNDLIRQRHALVNATLMFRTEVLKASGGFRINGAGEDWDFFLRMTELTRVANLNQVLYLYRVHSQSTNRVQARNMYLRYAHACECAQIRSSGGIESTFDEFCMRRRERPLLLRWVEELDNHASSLYRKGLERVLNESPLTGYGQLCLAAVISPKRLAQRTRRAIRAAATRSEMR